MTEPFEEDMFDDEVEGAGDYLIGCTCAHPIELHDEEGCVANDCDGYVETVE